jgi:hypothetical protein
MIRIATGLFGFAACLVAYSAYWWRLEDPFIRDIDKAIANITIYRAQTACISTDMRQADDWGEGFCD